MPATLPEAYHDNILQSILKKNSHNEKGQSALKKTLENGVLFAITSLSRSHWPP